MKTEQFIMGLGQCALGKDMWVCDGWIRPYPCLMGFQPAEKPQQTNVSSYLVKSIRATLTLDRFRFFFVSIFKRKFCYLENSLLNTLNSLERFSPHEDVRWPYITLIWLEQGIIPVGQTQDHLLAHMAVMKL